MVQLPVQSNLDVDDGIVEIARIFAAGILRRHQRNDLWVASGKIFLGTAPENACQGLEPSRELRLSVTRGYASRLS